MAGHSQFKNIMHRKGAQDAKRAKLFAKLAREITVAAKSGLIDPKQNPRLRTAILNARSENMPNDNIKKAISKASSSDSHESFTEIRYEGFGNNGISMIIEALTDNKNRTASEVRAVLTKNGGSLGENGSVAFNFKQVGEITFSRDDPKKDEIILFAIENGAIDIVEEESIFKIISESNHFGVIRNSIEQKFSEPTTSKLIWKAINLIKINKEEAKKLLYIVNTLEENEDIQNVYTNIEISEDIIKEICND